METDGEITHFSVSTTGYHSNPLVTMVTDDSIMFNLDKAYFILQDINIFSLVMEQGMVQRHHIIHIKAKKSLHLFPQKWQIVWKTMYISIGRYRCILVRISFWNTFLGLKYIILANLAKIKKCIFHN